MSGKRVNRSRNRRIAAEFTVPAATPLPLYKVYVGRCDTYPCHQLQQCVGQYHEEFMNDGLSYELTDGCLVNIPIGKEDSNQLYN